MARKALVSCDCVINIKAGASYFWKALVGVPKSIPEGMRWSSLIIHLNVLI